MKFSLQRGFTALILASLRGNFAAVKLLLQMGAEGNTQTNVSWTFRSLAWHCNCTFNCIHYLVKPNINIGAKGVEL